MARKGKGKGMCLFFLPLFFIQIFKRFQKNKEAVGKLSDGLLEDRIQ